MATNTPDNGTMKITVERESIAPRSVARRRFDAYLSQAMARLEAGRQEYLSCREALTDTLRLLLDTRMAAVAYARSMGQYAGQIYEEIEAFTRQIQTFAATLQMCCCETALEAGERAIDSAVECEIKVMGPLEER